MVVRQRRAIAGLWAAIWLLIVVGLSTSAIATLEETKPEIIIETCSLLAALFLVIVERLAVRNANRSGELNRIVEELRANAETLCTGVWTMDLEALSAELNYLRSGFRFYYTRLSSSAVSQAILGTTFDVVSDIDLITHLQRWHAAAEECNSRLAMGQRFLFSSPSSEDGVRERLDLHASMAFVPAVHAREALHALSTYLLAAADKGNLPRETLNQLEEANSLVTENPSVDASLEALDRLRRG